jgi:hypothetical protein
MAALSLNALGLLLGSVGALFFGGFAAVHTLRLFDRRPQVIIDRHGIYVRSHGDKRIAPRSIKGLHTDMGRLSLTLHKPAKYPIETRHRQFIYRINGSAAREFFGDVWIWTNMLDQPQSAFIEALAAHRPQTDFEKQLAQTIAANR